MGTSPIQPATSRGGKGGVPKINRKKVGGGKKAEKNTLNGIIKDHYGRGEERSISGKGFKKCERGGMRGVPAVPPAQSPV